MIGFDAVYSNQECLGPAASVLDTRDKLASSMKSSARASTSSSTISAAMARHFATSCREDRSGNCYPRSARRLVKNPVRVVGRKPDESRPKLKRTGSKSPLGPFSFDSCLALRLFPVAFQFESDCHRGSYFCTGTVRYVGSTQRNVTRTVTGEKAGKNTIACENHD
jgi:hypothetical protein